MKKLRNILNNLYTLLIGIIVVSTIIFLIVNVFATIYYWKWTNMFSRIEPFNTWEGGNRISFILFEAPLFLIMSIFTGFYIREDIMKHNIDNI